MSKRLFSQVVFDMTRGKSPNLHRIPKTRFGRTNRRGFFVFDPDKVPIFEAPDLTGFKVREYYYNGLTILSCYRM